MRSVVCVSSRHFIVKNNYKQGISHTLYVCIFRSIYQINVYDVKNEIILLSSKCQFKKVFPRSKVNDKSFNTYVYFN